MLKIVISLFIAATVAGLVTAFVKYRKIIDNPGELIATVQPGVDVALGDIHQTATRDGKKEWQLDAASANYFDDEKKLRLETLSMIFFLEGREPIRLTADSGVLETDTRNLVISGHVVLKNEGTRLTADSLSYRHEQRHISTRSPVIITGDGFQLSADSMIVDLDKKKAVFKGKVKGIFSEDLPL